MEWMAGRSLIAGELPQRPIFGVDRIKRETKSAIAFAVTPQDEEPPFYQFTGLSVIYCQKWYHLDLRSLAWESGKVEGSTSVCPAGSEITEQQAFQWIVGHLKENEFDVSNLEGISPLNK